MNDNPDKIERLISMSSDLLSFADDANNELHDDGCLCLFGLVKDCAYKIRTEAQRERRVHDRLERAGGEERSK